MSEPRTTTDDAATTAELGLRERNRRRTEAALRRATIELATEHGFEDVTVETICARAGVSPRTFFNYFSSKEDAVLQARPAPPSDDHLDHFVAGGPGGTLLPDLAELLATHLEGHLPSADDLVRHHDLLDREPRLQAHFRGALCEVEDAILEAIARRCSASTDALDVQVFGAVVMGTVRVAMLRWVRAGGDPGVRTHVQEAFDLLDRANVDDLLA